MKAEAVDRDAVRELVERGGSVKICGLREPEHAAAAVLAGADLVGFIFAPARRQVTPAVARSCIEAVRNASSGRTVITVGVFVDAAPHEIRGIAEFTRLDMAQLHGAEPPEFAQSLPVPAIKALRPRPDATFEQAIAEIRRYQDAAVPPVGFLVDAYLECAAGGTGARADWAKAAEINTQVPIFLAGGLNPENVVIAIGQVHPLGVDVSSGVETGGRKDATLIAEFIQSARTAFRNRRDEGA